MIGCLHFALALVEVPADAVADLDALIGACQGEPDAVAHARSLLNVAVAAQPPEGRRRRRAPAEAAS